MMKKTLIATAVASAFSLSAFADGHVSVGGYAATGFEFGDSETGGTTDGKDAPRGGNTTLSINASNDLDNGSQSYVSLAFTTDLQLLLTTFQCVLVELVLEVILVMLLGEWVK